jgi:hypothetical protein
MSKFLDQLQYLIDNHINHPSSKSSLIKAHAILASHNVSQSLDSILADRDAEEADIANWISRFKSNEEIAEIVERMSVPLRELGWVYCPDTTAPNMVGQRGWMNKMASQHGIYHVLRIMWDPTCDEDFHYECAIMTRENTHHCDAYDVATIMEWMMQYAEIEEAKNAKRK